MLWAPSLEWFIFSQTSAADSEGLAILLIVAPALTCCRNGYPSLAVVP